MSMQQIIDAVRGFDGSLVVRPEAGDDVPEVAWGDSFFYYAPDGRLPERTQPYATIVTKDYPGDTASALGGPDRWRVNVHVARGAFHDATGEDPRALSRRRDFAAADVVNPHPVYGSLGWICVVAPAERTLGTVLRLLREAHDRARARVERREATHSMPD
ncbi:DUF6194 family protein [Agromyces sp. ZXT2-6]|uniref:DUF6194 family protein n=1 Tax=Agromyces sp. ZXT2-6 TaxID=3461153 RepID=UPI004054CC44